MKIEDAIQQAKFSSEQNKLAINLIYTYNWLISNIKDIISPFGITHQQFNILRILRGQAGKPATILLLKERMLDKMSDASRLVERLRQKGLVERTPNQQDRRAVDIRITDKGLALLADIDEQISSLDHVLGGLSAEECQLMNNLLDKMRG